MSTLIELLSFLSKVRSGGVYIIEDLETSYFKSQDSGYLVHSTTIELIKRLVDSPQKSIFNYRLQDK